MTEHDVEVVADRMVRARLDNDLNFENKVKSLLNNEKIDQKALAKEVAFYVNKNSAIISLNLLSYLRMLRLSLEVLKQADGAQVKEALSNYCAQIDRILLITEQRLGGDKRDRKGHFNQGETI